MATNEPIIGDETPERRHRLATGLAPAGLAPQTPQSSQAAPVIMAREEDPETRAARRALEIREHLGGLDQGDDEFYIDPRIVPDGWSYEWKRYTTLGAQDPSYQVQLAVKGWESVPVSRHPQFMPDGYQGRTIERKGMILMERPLEITEEAKRIELCKARSQVRQKEQQLFGQPAGPNSPFEADNKGNPLVKIKKSYEPMPIPEK